MQELTEERRLMKILKQKPIRFTALEKCSVIASAAGRLSDGTCSHVLLGKDITVESAMNRGAFYGTIGGGAAMLHQHLRDLIVSRKGETLSLKDDIEDIALFYGPFDNLWNVSLW